MQNLQTQLELIEAMNDSAIATLAREVAEAGGPIVPGDIKSMRRQLNQAAQNDCLFKYEIAQSVWQMDRRGEDYDTTQIIDRHIHPAGYLEYMTDNRRRWENQSFIK